MSYTIYPTVDDATYKFSPEIMAALAGSSELGAAFAKLSDITPLLSHKADLDNTNKIPIAQIPTAQLPGALPPGFFGPWGGRFAPSGWSNCDCTTLARLTYPEAFSNLNPKVGNATITAASPGVFTLTAHGFRGGDQIYLTTTGTLLTGLSPNHLYKVGTVFTVNTFSVTEVGSNTQIATSGSQNGIHSVYSCPWGLGDGVTTFNKPNMMGVVPVGLNPSDTQFDNLGDYLGEAAHSLSGNENGYHNHSGADHLHGLPDHAHDFLTTINGSHNHGPGAGGSFWVDGGGNNIASGSSTSRQFTGATAAGGDHQHSGRTYGVANGPGATGGSDRSLDTGFSGTGAAHNNIQPSRVVNYIMKL